MCVVVVTIIIIIIIHQIKRKDDLILYDLIFLTLAILIIDFFWAEVEVCLYETCFVRALLIKRKKIFHDFKLKFNSKSRSTLKGVRLLEVHSPAAFSSKSN